ncbi:protein-L-isoaspartate O-methyltransferase [Devosia sp.]|jgi:protein-L-isoaspartate(D-aspartate) O-methyltransferase|uniref:protein-L-isoaspartate O-methyltransferase n=1 Tax=Devosia sp. TaxID=1871048 RepID=UPI0037BF8C91
MVDFERARKIMVDNQLRTSNVTDRRVLAAMLSVPREQFVPADRKVLAYIDDAHDLGHGRSLAAPAPFAKLLQLAEIESGDAVLDVGAGLGYSTAVLAQLAHEVIGVEVDAGLAAEAKKSLAAAGVSNADIVVGSFDSLAPGARSFDVIVLEGAVDMVPPGLFSLLAEGGRLVALIQRGAAAVANVYVKSGDAVNARAEFNASLPPLQSVQSADVFVF